MALAHSAGIHVERTDGEALRVIVCACAQFCGRGNRVTNQIEPRLISLTDVFKPNRTVRCTFNAYLFLCNHVTTTLPHLVTLFLSGLYK